MTARRFALGLLLASSAFAGPGGIFDDPFDDPKDEPPATQPAPPTPPADDPPPAAKRDDPPPVPSKPSVRAPAPSPAPPATKPARFAHLAIGDNGPPWSLDELASEIPAGTGSAAIDPAKTVPSNLPVEAALQAAFDRLALRNAEGHAVAYRIAGAMTGGNPNDPRPIKLLSVLTYYGIGARADPASACRTVLPLVRKGDIRACTFVAAEKPELFEGVATRVRSLKQLSGRPAVMALKCGGTVMSVDRGVPEATADTPARPPSLVLRADADVRIQLTPAAAAEPELEPGHYVDLAGYSDGKGNVVALIADVPEPSVAWQYKLEGRGVAGGRTQLRTVHVTFTNNGQQPVKRIKFSVRCYMENNAHADHSRDAEVADLAPGERRTVNVSFAMYNWLYIATSSVPKAQVTITEREW